MGLNWFIPALVNRSVGSSCGTTGLLGTNVWPCFCTKKSMNCRRISEEEVMNGASLPVKVPDYSRMRAGVQGGGWSPSPLVSGERVRVPGGSEIPELQWRM